MGLLCIDIGETIVQAFSIMSTGTTTQLTDGETCVILEKRDNWITVMLDTTESESSLLNPITCLPFLNLYVQPHSPNLSPRKIIQEPQQNPHPSHATELDPSSFVHPNVAPPSTRPYMGPETASIASLSSQYENVIESAFRSATATAVASTQEAAGGDLFEDSISEMAAVDELQSGSGDEDPGIIEENGNRSCTKVVPKAIPPEVLQEIETNCAKKSTYDLKAEEVEKAKKHKFTCLRSVLPDLEMEFGITINVRDDIIRSQEDEVDKHETIPLGDAYSISCMVCGRELNLGEITHHLHEKHSKEGDIEFIHKSYGQLNSRLSRISFSKCRNCFQWFTYMEYDKHVADCSDDTGNVAKIIRDSDDKANEENVRNEMEEKDTGPNERDTGHDHMDTGQNEDTKQSAEDIGQNGAETNLTKNKDKDQSPCSSPTIETTPSSVRNNDTSASSRIKQLTKKRHYKRRVRKEARDLDNTREEETEIMRELEKDYGVKIELLATEVPSLMDDTAILDRRYSISCVACGDQIPQNSIAMHFKENHPERSDTAKVLCAYTKIKRKLRDIKQERCQFCDKSMRSVNLKRHQDHCKMRRERTKTDNKQPKTTQTDSRSEQAEQSIPERSQSQQSIPTGSSTDTEIEQNPKSPTHDTSIQKCLTEIGEQFDVTINLIGNGIDIDEDDETDIFQEQLHLITISCQLCNEDVACTEMNGHFKIAHSELPYQRVTELQALYTKIKRRIRELKQATCRFCGKGIRTVHLATHMTHCNLNPANNAIDVEDIAAEQREIDAILEKIHDTYNIRIVCANTLQPVKGRVTRSSKNKSKSITKTITRSRGSATDQSALEEKNKTSQSVPSDGGNTGSGVINESFIVTCSFCAAQFEHFDIEQHLVDCHGDESMCGVVKERYRQALVMLVGDSESECVFCNEKHPIAELSSHMQLCRRKQSRAKLEATVSAVTDLDLLVQSLSRRFQVEISRCPVYAEEEEETHETQPAFLVTCQFCNEGVLHLAMRSHIRKFHDTECDADTLHKYTKIARRLQDLRKIKCVYCEKFFRVVSLRVHMRKCRATPEVNTEKVVRSLRGGDTAEENSSSLSDKAHEAKMRNNVEPQVICEAIFAKFRVKVAHKAGEYTVTCEICEGNFSLQLINMHIKALHGDLKDSPSLVNRYKHVVRRIKDAERRQKAQSVECPFCCRKIKKLYSSSFNMHLRQCPMNPDRESVKAVTSDVIATIEGEGEGHWEVDKVNGKVMGDNGVIMNEKVKDEGLDDTDDDERITVQVCDICDSIHETATSLIHHLTKEHSAHARYMELWENANRSRHEIMTKKVRRRGGVGSTMKKQEKVKKCDGCEFTATSAVDMKQHKSTCKEAAGSGQRSYVCHICGFESKTYSSRWYHMKTRHGLALGTKKAQFYPCPLCGKVCDVPSRLEKHLLTHTDQRNYICDECAQPFKTSFALHRHIERLHKNIYPYYCDKCGHGLKNKMWLERHQCGRARKQRVARISKNKFSENPEPKTKKSPTKRPRTPRKATSKKTTIEIFPYPTPQAPNAITITPISQAFLPPYPPTMGVTIQPTLQPITNNTMSLPTVQPIATNNTMSLPIGSQGQPLAAPSNNQNAPINNETAAAQQPLAVDVSAYFQQPPVFDFMDPLKQNADYSQFLLKPDTNSTSSFEPDSQS